MNSLLKRTWAEIHLDHLTHNLDIIRRRVGPDVTLLGVVKADAYGHGAVRVAKYLETIGAGYLAVANIDEAEELRANGVALPILALGFSPPEQSARILRLGVTQCIPNLEAARACSAYAARAGKKMKVHIKLDTGMGRLGFPCDDARFDASLRDILEVLRLPGLDAEGIFTHFSVADEDAPEHAAFTETQYARFRKMTEAAESASGVRFRLHHCCNSGGIASHPEWAGDMVRCGILLYGTGGLAERLGMKPVMTLKTAVASIQDVPPGTDISYGRTFTTARPSRIAVLPIGYADGLFRSLSNRLTVWTPYGPARQVGRICMDMCMIDATELPRLAVGDELEIYGEHCPCEAVAQRCGTISYELLSAVSKRIPRWYYLGGACVDRNLQLLY